MSDEVEPVTLMGRLPKTVLSACLNSATAAGLVPSAVYRIGECSAVVLGKDQFTTLYVRWRGRRTSRVEWSYDPDLFGRRFRAESRRLLSELLSDPATSLKRVRLSRKTPPPVS